MIERVERRPTLDQRISQVLGDGKIAVDDLQVLVQQVEAGIEEAAQIATKERQRALDPSTSPNDAEQATQHVAIAELKRDRYRTALPRLQQKLAEALHAEHCADWNADADQVDKRTDAAAEQLGPRYRECAAAIVAALVEAEDANREVDRINGSAPDNVHRRLLKVDLAWTKNLTLPDFDHPDRNLWPRPQPSLAAIYATTMVPAHDPRYSADWAKAREADAERLREQQRRLGEFYERMTKEQEARQNREEAERFAQSQQRRG